VNQIAYFTVWLEQYYLSKITERCPEILDCNV